MFKLAVFSFLTPNTPNETEPPSLYSLQYKYASYTIVLTRKSNHTTAQNPFKHTLVLRGK